MCNLLKINYYENFILSRRIRNLQPLGLLLLAMFGEESVFVKHPFPELPLSPEEINALSFEEKQKFYKENLTGY